MKKKRTVVLKMDSSNRLRYTGFQNIDRRISSYWDRGYLTKVGYKVLKEYMCLESEFLSALICTELCIHIKDFPDIIIKSARKRLNKDDIEFLESLDKRSFKELQDDNCLFEER